MPEERGRKQTFRCMEPGCSDTVSYRPKIVLGMGDYDDEPEERVVTVYLTCPRGHTHMYEIQVKG